MYVKLCALVVVVVVLFSVVVVVVAFKPSRSDNNYVVTYVRTF